MQTLQEQAVAQNQNAGNHCPFGCAEDDQVLVAEAMQGGKDCPVMYCCHLVGFTNDRKVMEGIEPVMVPVYDEEHRRTDGVRWNGRFRVTSKKRQYIKKTDVLVNPQVYQIDKEHSNHMTETWGSARVYRQCTDREAVDWQMKFVAVDGELGPPPIEDAETPQEKKKRLLDDLKKLEHVDIEEGFDPEEDEEDEDLSDSELEEQTKPGK